MLDLNYYCLFILSFPYPVVESVLSELHTTYFNKHLDPYFRSNQQATNENPTISDIGERMQNSSRVNIHKVKWFIDNFALVFFNIVGFARQS